MNTFIRLIFISLIFAALKPKLIFAAGMFEDFPISPRVISMGGAAVALADDASGVRSNPAGMAQCDKVELESSYADIYGADGLCFTSISAIFPSGKNSSWGGAWQRLSLPDVYCEDVFTIAFARQFSDSVAVGLSISDLRSAIIGDFAAPFYKGDVRAATLDVGLLWQIADDWLMGGSLERINEPLPTGSSEKLSSRQRLGLKYQPFESGIIVIEYAFAQSEIKAGFEVVVGKILPVRIGVNRARPTFGLGVQIGHLGGVDFAMITDSNLGNLYYGGFKVRF